MTMSFPAFWLHRGDAGQWSWEFLISDGVVIARSDTSYSTAQDCAYSIKMMREADAMATFTSLSDLDALASGLHDGMPRAAVPMFGEELILTQDAVKV